MRIEWRLDEVRREIFGAVLNGAHESSYTREEKLGVADRAFDLEGRDSEPTQIGGMTQIAENEHTAKRDEEQPQDRIRMACELLENRNA
jgi:hypothetical protein